MLMAPPTASIDRTERLNVLLSEEEQATLAALASVKGLSVSDYIRAHIHDAGNRCAWCGRTAVEFRPTKPGRDNTMLIVGPIVSCADCRHLAEVWEKRSGTGAVGLEVRHALATLREATAGVLRLPKTRRLEAARALLKRLLLVRTDLNAKTMGRSDLELLALIESETGELEKSLSAAAEIP